MAEERKQIGAYTVLERLQMAEGAQGRIYVAAKDGTKYILKAPEHAAHRQAEIQAWKTATQNYNPHVLSLIETVTDTVGQIYLVSPFVEQGTLKDWLAAQPGNKAPTRDEALAIFRGIVSGLAHVHAAELTHRDLKPANILLAQLHPILMDFGLARLTKKSIVTMGPGGTLAYAPPEIAIELMKEMMGLREESRSLVQQATPISKRGDVWSAAVIFYELLLGKRPFDDIDTLRDKTISVPGLETLPAPLALFLTKALAKDPAQRFANGQELTAAFKSMEADLREWEIQQRIAAEQAKLKKAEDEAAKAQATAETERKRREEAEKAAAQAKKAKERAEAQTKPSTISRRVLIGTGLVGLVGSGIVIGKLFGSNPLGPTPTPQLIATPESTPTPVSMSTPSLGKRNPTGLIRILRYEDTSYVRGVYYNNAIRNLTIAAAKKAFGGIVRDETTLSNDKGTFGWPNQILRTLSVLKNIQLLDVSAGGDVLIIAGNVASVAEREKLSKVMKAILPEGVMLDNRLTLAGETHPAPEPAAAAALHKVVREQVQHTVDTVVASGEIRFSTASSRILAESYPYLNRVAEVFKSQNAATIMVGGHSDDQGTVFDNISLTQARADAVRLYLIARGVSSQRLFAKGFGSSQPIASNATEEGRRRNRRINFVVL